MTDQVSSAALKEGIPLTESSQDGLSVTAYRGVGSVLLAFNLPHKPPANFAGFAVKRTEPNGKGEYLYNRLNFSQHITSTTTPEKRRWTHSDKAPFQKFRWMDFPKNIQPGEYTYDVQAMYFKSSGNSLEPGQTAQLKFPMSPEDFGNFEMGFTSGYLSSQAYASRFKNAPVRPKGQKTYDFDTKPYLKRYEWLGADARRMIFKFLQEAIDDPGTTVDAFAYDLDEPDIIRALALLGSRLRLYLDDATLHKKKGAVEPLVRELLEEKVATVKTGHFQRFAHSKVFIQNKNGVPVKVLTGSANFSVRGLYVQANNVLVFNEPSVAQLYSQAFHEAFTNPKGFTSAKIAEKWHHIEVSGCPDCHVSFAPHIDAQISLQRVTDEVKNADHSVLFAIMELGGGGSVLDEIRKLPDKEIFSFGVTQSADDLKLFKPGQARGRFLPFSYLQGKIPKNFKKEWSGGSGQVVHHKFIVVDFNDTDPVLFTGSSNLSSGGENKNGDNLLAIYDRGIATAYAVEAMRLLDHYQFRLAMKDATAADPLMLQDADAEKKWWEPYYEVNDIKHQDRLLFSK